MGWGTVRIGSAAFGHHAGSCAPSSRAGWPVLRATPMEWRCGLRGQDRRAVHHPRRRPGAV